MNRINNFIDGKVHPSNSEKYEKVFDPSSGQAIAEVLLSNENDLNDVLNSSKNAFKVWSNFTPLKRSRILSNYKIACLS